MNKIINYNNEEIFYEDNIIFGNDLELMTFTLENPWKVCIHINDIKKSKCDKIYFKRIENSKLFQFGLLIVEVDSENKIRNWQEVDFNNFVFQRELIPIYPKRVYIH
jgi:hypothetical protein